MLELVVTEPFRLGKQRYRRGDLIDDPEIVATVERNFARHVVRRARPARPAEKEA